MNASYTLLYIKAAMLKKRKQCPCKPSSVFLYQICCYAVFISDIRMSVIYLVPKSPLGSSTLPSTAALRQSDEPPSICGIHELTAPRWHSLTITRQLVVSYTTFSPLLSPTVGIGGGAVIFFYRHLLSPIASSFGSGMLYAARTFLSHLKDASDRPEHCFLHAKVQKTFDTIARFLTFLYIIN
jgi:hypothetical protein